MTGPGGATRSGSVTARGDKTATPATLQTMGLAYIHAWLTEDYWTIAQITLALEASGATWQQVAESFSLAAASLLTDVCGGDSTHAAALAATKAHSDAARQARAAIRSAELPRLYLHPGAHVISWRGGRFCRGRSLGLGLTARLHLVVIGGLPFGPVGLDLGGLGRQFVQPGVQRCHPAGSVSPGLVGFRLWARFRVGRRRGRLRTPRGGRPGNPGITRRPYSRILDSGRRRPRIRLTVIPRLRFDLSVRPRADGGRCGPPGLILGDALLAELAVPRGPPRAGSAHQHRTPSSPHPGGPAAPLPPAPRSPPSAARAASHTSSGIADSSSPAGALFT